MTDMNATELLAVGGGSKCEGIWIGTNDGLYGLCLGAWS